MQKRMKTIRRVCTRECQFVLWDSKAWQQLNQPFHLRLETGYCRNRINSSCLWSRNFEKKRGGSAEKSPRFHQRKWNWGKDEGNRNKHVWTQDSIKYSPRPWQRQPFPWIYNTLIIFGRIGVVHERVVPSQTFFRASFRSESRSRVLHKHSLLNYKRRTSRATFKQWADKNNYKTDKMFA